jgi:hypothetical protein
MPTLIKPRALGKEEMSQCRDNRNGNNLGHKKEVHVKQTPQKVYHEQSRVWFKNEEICF